MERRTLLVGGTAAFSTVIAGCVGTDDELQETSGGDDDSPDDGSDESGSEDGDDDDGEERNALVGELVEGEDIHLVVEGVDRTDQLDEFTEADAGNELVVVSVAYKNVGDEFHTVSGFLSSRVRDAEDYTYDQSIYGTAQALNDGQIAPGELERGDVVYEVPEDATNLSLEFDFDLGLFGTLQRATIDLEAEADDPHVLEQDLRVDVHDVGAGIEHEGTTVTVNEIETATELDEFTAAGDGREFVIVDITVANDTGEEQHVSTLLQMQLKDDDGYSYGEDLGAVAALDQAFEEGSPIADGDQRRGRIAYEVAEGLTPLYWVFEFALFDQGDKTFWGIR
ncbi:DUF4352 domain-containing protein [Natrarchaeobius chitinivorans]|uniref:DUF4352 domain-containing protein n=1 Tax=Natrarchaeobius chitinivorans TaxID=1679083 RepID=A0A3N6LRE0_NATCH|nr:DUF4352 domain-containing protein [Natrarchaeobius chitinivorans]RQG90947.1 DUF4352 domain-containing protein [Natrarchaeobius chitinivorans]